MDKMKTKNKRRLSVDIFGALLQSCIVSLVVVFIANGASIGRAVGQFSEYAVAWIALAVALLHFAIAILHLRMHRHLEEQVFALRDLNARLLARVDRLERVLQALGRGDAGAHPKIEKRPPKGRGVVTHHTSESG